MVSTIPVTEKCNQNCIYCSAKERGCMSDKEIKKAISKEKEFIIISGGETTLADNLFEYLQLAKATGAKIELQSNGVTFSYKNLAKRLVDFGIDLFNIAMPSHIEEIGDKITRTRGFYKKRLQGIRNLIELGAKVRITEIINSLNYKFLLEYVKFIKENFPKVCFIELNYIKMMGAATKEMVPDYKDAVPYLQKTMHYCKENRINFLVDHIPICYLNGFEEYHPDVEKIVNKISGYYLEEKEYVGGCKSCTLKVICKGPRKDHIKIGKGKVIPSSKDPNEIIKRLRNG